MVHHGGGRFEIYGYPREVFPPTDFHSATLVGPYLYIIGCLGYKEERSYGHTPVFRLHCETLAIERVTTTGDNPGWISRHRAQLNGNEIEVWGGNLCTADAYLMNTGHHALNLETRIWRRVKE